jgi:hypothetical protein
MRNWSAEEQTMMDLIELGGYDVLISNRADYYVVQLFKPDYAPATFKADTEHEALRKAFNVWSSTND